MSSCQDEEEMIPVGSQMMTPAQVRELVQRNADEGVETEIYKWELPEEKPVDAPIPMRDVKYLVGTTLQIVHEISRQDTSLSDEELKVRVLKNPVMHRFHETHPHLFLMLCKRQVDVKRLNNVMELILIRELHERGGTVKENTTQISTYFMENFLRPQTEEDNLKK